MDEIEIEAGKVILKYSWGSDKILKDAYEIANQDVKRFVDFSPICKKIDFPAKILTITLKKNKTILEDLPNEEVKTEPSSTYHTFPCPKCKKEIELETRDGCFRKVREKQKGN